MQIIDRGDGTPDTAIVSTLHGDEICGRKAIERLLDEIDDFREPVRFVVANEKASEQDRRSIDEDLNRLFPAVQDPDNHEQRLAKRLEQELDGMTVLDLHATVSHDRPYALYTQDLADLIPLIRATGVEQAVDIGHVAGGLIDHVHGIAIECGPKGTEKAEQQAYNVAKNFLANQGVIEGTQVRSDPVIYRITDDVTKGEDWRFTATNFTEVAEGEEYASVNSQPITAEDSFYPVLMSTDGYDDILGFQAERLGPASNINIRRTGD